MSTNCTLVSVGCTCYDILKLQPLYLLFCGSSISTFSFQCKQNTFGMFSFAKLDTIPSQNMCFLLSKTLNTFETFAHGIQDLFLSSHIWHKIFLFEHGVQPPRLSSKTKLTHTAKNVEWYSHISNLLQFGRILWKIITFARIRKRINLLSCLARMKWPKSFDKIEWYSLLFGPS